MKRLILLGGVLVLCFGALTYLARIKAGGDGFGGGFAGGLTGSMMGGLMTQGARSSGNGDVSNRITNLENNVRNDIKEIAGVVRQLENRIMAVEAKVK